MRLAWLATSCLLAGCGTAPTLDAPTLDAPLLPLRVDARVLTSGVEQDGNGVFRLCSECPVPTVKRIAVASPPLRMEPRPVPPPAVPVVREERIVVHFALASDRLSAKALATLRDARDRFLGAGSVSVVGMTDQVGRRAFNARLAARRAEAVRGVLLGMGIAPSRISIDTHCCAESPPVVNPPARRAVISIRTTEDRHDERQP